MNKILLLLMLVSFGLITGCDDSISLGNDFEVSYVDIPEYRNIYYKQQGVFSSLGVNQIIYNKDKILVRGYLYSNGNTRLDRSTYIYYMIDKKAYVMDPSQQNSMGLVGPLLFEEYQSIVKKLKDAETEDW